MKNATVAVLGGGGKQGQSCILDLLRNKDAENIIAVDMNQKALAQLQQRASNDPRLEAQNFFIEDRPKLVKLLEKSDICINGLVYTLNLDIMEICLEATCHYIDFGGLFHMTKKQWKLHDRFKERAITAILGMGSCPGTTNITARYAVDQLDAVSEVHAICGVRSEETGEFVPEFRPSYSIKTIMSEHSDPAVIFSEGQYKEVEPMTGMQLMTFPEIGGVYCYYILHSEVASYPEVWRDKGIREASFRLGVPKLFLDKVMLLKNLGFYYTEPFVVKGKKAPSPVDYLEALLAAQEFEEVRSKRRLSEETSYVLRSHVIGLRDGQSIEYFIDTLVPQCPQWGLNEEELGTGTSPAIAASMMLRGIVSQTGVFPPEAIIPAEPYLLEIEKRFMPTKITVTRNFAASR